MIANAPPSVSPANRGSILGLLKHFMLKTLQQTDDMLPAKVISYNRKSNRAMVQPLISYVTTDSQIVARAQVASVPVFRFGAGGFAVNFPMKPGDLGWIKANDRDISLFKQSGISSPPHTERKHTFEDAMFFPDIIFQVLTISDEDTANMVLQNYAGTSKIAISEEYISLVTGAVGIGGVPSENCVLDIQSTNKAVAFPRMTTAQKNAIPNPFDGMVVFDTNEHGLSVYALGAWS